MSLLERFRRTRSAERVPACAEVAAPHADPDEDLLRYPPFIKGLPACAVDALLTRQGELLRRLQDGVGMTDEDYGALFLPVVRRFAGFVHLLPASEAHHHRGSGGLLRHALEVAFLASQASMRHVFALDREPRDRYHLEPRWRVAAGLAGLLHDLGKPVADVTVCDRDGQRVWSPYDRPLLAWARAQGVDRYFLRWRDTREHNVHVRMGTLVLHHILTPEIESWLGRDPAILANLIAVVGGQEQASILGTLVTNADRASVERDLRENRLDPNAHALGVPVDRYLIDAMRRLVREGAWTVNVPGARLWMLHDGLHVVWPQGGDDIYALLAQDHIPAIPRSPETIADVLVERGHVLTYREEGRDRFYRRRAPAPLAKDGKPVYLTMLLLASPELVFSGHSPAPVPLAEEGGAQTLEAAPALPWPAVERPSKRGRVGGELAANRSSQGDRSTGELESFEDGNADVGLDTRPVPAGTDSVCASAPPPDLRPAAREWLAGRGDGGRTLLRLAESIATADPGASGLRTQGTSLLIPYPEGLTGIEAGGGDGEPPRLLQLLWDAGLLLVDARRPLLRVREIDGRIWAVLTAEASTAFSACLGPDLARSLSLGTHASESPSPGPNEAGATPEITRARGAAKKAIPRGNLSRAIAEEIAAQCEQGQVRVEHGPDGLLLGTATLEALAEERRMPVAKLIRLLQFQAQFRPHPRGVLLARRP